MTGAELRAWREKLDKDEAWVEELLDMTRAGEWPVSSGAGNGEFRRRVCEGDVAIDRIHYSDGEQTIYRTAYRAALEAEEARQAAERGPVEPVCPEGVTVSRGSTGSSIYLRDVFAATVNHDGTLENWGIPRNPQHTADVVAFVAAFMRYTSALHADRQRKLDAVKVAEEAYAKAGDAVRAAERECDKASDALVAARREAGL